MFTRRTLFSFLGAAPVAALALTPSTAVAKIPEPEIIPQRTLPYPHEEDLIHDAFVLCGAIYSDQSLSASDLEFGRTVLRASPFRPVFPEIWLAAQIAPVYGIAPKDLPPICREGRWTK